MPLYTKVLINKLELRYIKKSLLIKEKLLENIKTQETFSITLGI
jgi:hypothetical protein